MHVHQIAAFCFGILSIGLCNLAPRPTDTDSSSSDDGSLTPSQPRVNTNFRIACNTGGDVCWYTDGTSKVALHARNLISHPENLKINTRCNPQLPTEIQRFSGNDWTRMFSCESGGTCHELNGLAGCYMGNHVNVIPGLHHIEVRQIPFQAEPDSSSGKYPTRCNPLKKSEVQYFDGKNWHFGYRCADPAICDDVQGVGVCLYLPIATRCNPDDSSEIQRFDGKKWVSHYPCPYWNSCVELNGIGTCHLGNNRLQTLTQHQQRADPESKVPDLHSVDTRCNPATFSEIQAFNGTHWNTYFVCPEDSPCKDLNGIGACHLQGTTYLVPAYNDTSHITPPIRDPPYRRSTRCNPDNATESQTWNGTTWNLDGICTPPYNCYDFEGDAGFTVCAYPSPVSKTIWLPLPLGSKPSSPAPESGAKMTKCKNEKEVFVWNGSDWVFHRTCSAGWRCGTLAIPPHEAVCYASSLASVVHHLDGRNGLWLSSSSDDSCSELSDFFYPPGYPKPCSTTAKSSMRLARTTGPSSQLSNVSCTDFDSSSSSDEEARNTLDKAPVGEHSFGHGAHCHNNVMPPHFGIDDIFSSATSKFKDITDDVSDFLPTTAPREEDITARQLTDIFSWATSKWKDVTDDIPGIQPTLAPRYEGMHARRVANHNKPDEDQ